MFDMIQNKQNKKINVKLCGEYSYDLFNIMHDTIKLFNYI